MTTRTGVEADAHPHGAALLADLIGFRAFGKSTEVLEMETNWACGSASVPVLVNEYWTARQRQGHSLHEVSYRACFKPQLPAFFLQRLTREGDVVFDPFLGRGTTALEAALAGRVPWGSDVNPLSRMLLLPRILPPHPLEIADRLRRIGTASRDLNEDLLVFYHQSTLQRLQSLRSYLLDRGDAMDEVDSWIRMVALNRLTGHSPGFFSVYTLPPNQAVSLESQRKINAGRNQAPPARDVDRLILLKTRSLLRSLTPLHRELLRNVASMARIVVGDSRSLPALENDSVALTVTSPPFLDVVDYAGDNWLRCWFAGIDPKSVPITLTKDLGEWRHAMSGVLAECYRLTRPGGWLAFEVGEIRNGTVKLEEAVLPCGIAAGWEPVLVLINSQHFTKTSNCWGVKNNTLGTNTNRIVLFRKPA